MKENWTHKYVAKEMRSDTEVSTCISNLKRGLSVWNFILFFSKYNLIKYIRYPCKFCLIEKFFNQYKVLYLSK